jgi:hypothetical protein
MPFSGFFWGAMGEGVGHIGMGVKGGRTAVETAG